MFSRSLILFLISILVHELGHYIGFRFFKLKPNIKITWWGISIGENVSYKLDPASGTFVSILGPVFGVGFLLLFKVPTTILLIHLIASSIDIAAIIDYLSVNIVDWDKSILVITKEKIKKIENGENTNE